MIRRDVKSIRILGKFFAKNVMGRQEANMTIAIHMQKNIDQKMAFEAMETEN
jgi:hypothetical protein